MPEFLDYARWMDERNDRRAANRNAGIESVLAGIMGFQKQKDYDRALRRQEDLEQQRLSQQRDYHQQRLGLESQRLDIERERREARLSEKANAAKEKFENDVGAGMDYVLSQPPEKQREAYGYWLDDMQSRYGEAGFAPEAYGFPQPNQFNPAQAKQLRERWRRMTPRPPPQTRAMETMQDGVSGMEIVEDVPGTFRPSPPTTAPKVTYGAPQVHIVGGKRIELRPGSDGRMYDLNLRPIAAEQIAPEPERGPAAPTQRFQPKQVTNEQGDVVEANYDSLTGKYFDANTGQPLQNIKPPPTAEMKNRQDALKGLVPTLRNLRTLSESIITRVGPAQRADALKRGVEAVFGTDPDFTVYRDFRAGLAVMIAVATQGSRPSDADVFRAALPLVPDPYRDTSESASKKWNMIFDMFRNRLSAEMKRQLDLQGEIAEGAPPPPAKINPFSR